MEGYSMVSEAQARATAKYQKKTYDRVDIKLRKDSGAKQKYQDYADSLDLPLAVFIVKALDYVVDHNIKLK